ncbi:glyoxalase superfamily protein, partial [Rhizobiaceae sp. 2RAB30]
MQLPITSMYTPRAMARTLRQAATGLGFKIPHADSWNQIACILGWEDWNDLCALRGRSQIAREVGSLEDYLNRAHAVIARDNRVDAEVAQRLCVPLKPFIIFCLNEYWQDAGFPENIISAPDVDPKVERARERASRAVAELFDEMHRSWPSISPQGTGYR